MNIIKTISVIVLLFIPIVCGATTYTVCASGCDQTTIQAAVNAATTAGDVVEVRADTVGGTKTYAERITTAAGGTSGNYITIQERSGDTIILNSVTKAGFIIAHPYVKVKGFEITGALDDSYAAIEVNPGTAAANRGEYCWIEDNYIHDLPSARNGILIKETSGLNTPAQYCTIKNNTLKYLKYAYINSEGNGTLIEGNTIQGFNNAIALNMNDSDAMRIWGIGVTIRGNDVSGLDGTCPDDCGSPCSVGCTVDHPDFIQTFYGGGASHPSNNVTVEKNYVHDFGLGAQTGNLSSDGDEENIHSWVFRNNIFANVDVINIFIQADFYNNTFYQASASAHPLQYAYNESAGAGNGIVRNNIFLGNAGGLATEGWYAVPVGTTVTASYNYCSRGSTQSYGTCTGFSETGGVNGGDPKLLNVGAGTAAGFALTINSTILINSGSIVATFSTDYIGTSRPYGAEWDIGAYEWFQTGSIHGVTSMGVSKK